MAGAGQIQEEIWGAAVGSPHIPAPRSSPGLKTVAERLPKLDPLGKRSAGSSLYYLRGLVGTLLAADREGTLTSAGRSHPAPRLTLPGLGGHGGAPKMGQDRGNITVLRAAALELGALNPELCFLPKKINYPYLENGIEPRSRGALSPGGCWHRHCPGNRTQHSR